MRRFVVVLCSLALLCVAAAPVMAAKPNLQFTTHLTCNGDKLGGTPASGFTVETDGVVGAMLTLGLTGTKTHPGLAPGDYAFKLGPGNHTALQAYFDAKSWPSAYHAQINAQINGTKPFFYLTYHDGAYFLADGFTWGLSSGTVKNAPLRIDDDYPVGSYTYIGTLIGTNKAELDISITMTVVRD